MKRFVLSVVATLMGFVCIVAQNVPVNLAEGSGNGITLNGTNTLISSDNGGEYMFPKQDYSTFSGLKIKMINFQKLNENVSDAICTVNVYYIQDEVEQKAVMSFWVEGRKNVKFDSFKNGNDIISINPKYIQKVSFSMGGNKQFDATVELQK